MKSAPEHPILDIIVTALASAFSVAAYIGAVALLGVVIGFSIAIGSLGYAAGGTIATWLLSTLFL